MKVVEDGGAIMADAKWGDLVRPFGSDDLWLITDGANQKPGHGVAAVSIANGAESIWNGAARCEILNAEVHIK